MNDLRNPRESGHDILDFLSRFKDRFDETHQMNNLAFNSDRVTDDPAPDSVREEIIVVLDEALKKGAVSETVADNIIATLQYEIIKAER